MVDPALKRWAVSALRDALNEIPGLLMGPDSPTPDYQAWESSVKRALHAGFGDNSAFVSQFETLTFVSAAAIGTIGKAGSWERVEARNSPHNILSASKRLLADAVGALGGSVEDSANRPSSDVSRPEGFQAPEPATAASEDQAVPVAFVSYSWESSSHQAWVLDDFATRLRESGVRSRLDRWEVKPGYELPAFMESAIRDSTYVLVVCTPTYKKKSDGRTGGVGFENSIMSGERFGGGKAPGKFIPILRAGAEQEAVPTWLIGRMYIDLRGEPGSEHCEAEFARLLNTLHGYDESPPPVGQKPPRPPARAKTSAAPRPDAVPSVKREASAESNEPIRIVQIAVDKLGRPRNDGTRGSALYAVPLELSGKPSSDWAELFVQTWDHPPSFTSMHRPGIARVEGKYIVLDGTTVDEVRDTHRDTLKLVLDAVNRAVEDRRRAREQRKAERVQREADDRAEIARRARDIEF